MELEVEDIQKGVIKMVDLNDKQAILRLANEFTISEGAYKYYLQHIARGEWLSGLEVRKKMVRNMLLGVQIKGSPDDYVKLYKYGSMSILVNGMKIINVNNRAYKKGNLKRDDMLKKQLDEILDINY